MRNLWREGLRRHGAFLLTCATLLAAFEYLVCGIISKVDLSGAMENLLVSLPPALREILKEQLFGGFSTRGMLAFGWNHTVPHALGGALAILLASRAIAGEIGEGALELLLAQPVSRRRYLFARAAFGLGALALLAAGGAAGTFAGGRVFRLEPLPGALLLALAASYFLLQAAWFGVTLACSSWGRDGGTVASAAFSAAMVAFVIQTAGRLWAPAAPFLPVSLYHYHAPETILTGGSLPWERTAVLAIVALAGMGFAWWRFERRDIP